MVIVEALIEVAVPETKEQMQQAVKLGQGALGLQSSKFVAIQDSHLWIKNKLQEI